MNATPEQYQVKAAIDDIKAFNVAGISIVTNNETAAEDINALWERFFKEQIGQKIEDKENDVIYGVYSDYEGDHTKPYRYTIGYRVPETPANDAAPASNSAAAPSSNNDDSAPSTNNSKGNNPSPLEGLHYVKCISGTYAILSAAGNQPQALIDAWTSIWESDLERVFCTDYETYGPRFFEPGIHEVLLHIGIKENNQ